MLEKFVATILNKNKLAQNLNKEKKGTEDGILAMLKSNMSTVDQNVNKCMVCESLKLEPNSLIKQGQQLY